MFNENIKTITTVNMNPIIFETLTQQLLSEPYSIILYDDEFICCF